MTICLNIELEFEVKNARFSRLDPTTDEKRPLQNDLSIRS